MTQTRFISAICTPLDDSEALHVEGLESHIEEQITAGIAGILVAGSMGFLQLLRDETYRALIKESVRHTKGRCELLAGISDMSLSRTLERLRFAEQLDVDGLVVLAPWFFTYSSDELGDYFRELADRAKKPLYIYDLPQRTGVSLEHDLLVELSKHPNIVGVKCSGDWQEAQKLMSRVRDGFRVIPAQPQRILELVKLGIRDNLDGVYSLVPEFTLSIATAAEAGDEEIAEERQNVLNDFLQLLIRHGLYAAVSELFKVRGIGGHVTVAPYRPLSTEEAASFRADPALKRILQTS